MTIGPLQGLTDQEVVDALTQLGMSTRHVPTMIEVLTDLVARARASVAPERLPLGWSSDRSLNLDRSLERSSEKFDQKRKAP